MLEKQTVIERYLRRALIALVVIYLVWRLKQTVQLLLVSLFFAAGITPLVHQMRRYGIKRGWSIGIIYTILLLIIFMTVAPAPKIAVELGQFFTKLPELLKQIQLPDLSLFGVSPQQISEIVQSRFLEQAQVIGKEIASQTVDISFKILNALGIALMTMLITGFMVVYADQLLRKCLSPFSSEIRTEVYTLIPPITQCVGSYVLGRMGTSALLGFCTYVAIAFIGVPFAGALGLLVAVSNLIPFVGPILGLIPMVIAAGGLGVVKIGLVIGISFLFQQIEAWVLQPWLVGPYLNLDPFELLLSIIVGAELLGVVGAVFAPPIAGIGRIVYDYFSQKHTLAAATETEDSTVVQILRESSDLEDHF